MKKIYTIINRKGGTGKTTTSHNLGSILNQRGYNVLFIDLDAQGNLTSLLNINKKSKIIELLKKEISPQNAIVKNDKGDIIPSSSALARADSLFSEIGSEYLLREILNNCKEYDYIIIDTPPSMGLLTAMALVSCTDVIITAQADTFSLQGIKQLYNTIKTAKERCNPELNIDGILITRYNGHTNIGKTIKEKTEDIANTINTKVFKSPIRESIAIKESQALKQDIITYSKKSNPAIDYFNFVNELID